MLSSLLIIASQVGHWHSEKGLYIQTVIGRPKGQMKFTNRTRIITSMVVS